MRVALLVTDLERGELELRVNGITRAITEFAAPGISLSAKPGDGTDREVPTSRGSLIVLLDQRGGQPLVQNRILRELSDALIADPALAPPGKSVIILQSAAVEEFAQGWGADRRQRTEAYRNTKDRVADQLIANTEKIIPGLREKIEVTYTASPLTYYRYTLNSGGATGGWSKHVEKTFTPGLKGALQIGTPVKNLYQAGHWTSFLGGAPIGMMSGRLAAGLVNFRLKWGI